MKKFGAAIIGCGAIHKLHAGAIISSPHSQLISVVDIDKSRASEAASYYGCGKYYTDYREMLKDEAVDVVHICTPHYLHATMAIDAMKSGKHVLTEKPIAISSKADGIRMVKVSEETGKYLCVCFQNRFNTTATRIKEVLESGKVGAVKGARAFVTWHRDVQYYSESGWRGTWEKEGGGVLINQAIHTLDLLQWFIGDVDRIKGSVDTRLLQGVIEVEDTAEATIIFKNGATALFYATNCHVSNSPVELEIICENAVIKLADELIISYNSGDIERVEETDKLTGKKAYWGCGHAALIRDFYSRLADDRKPAIDGKEGLKALQMVEAIYKSHKMGKYVDLV